MPPASAELQLRLRTHWDNWSASTGNERAVFQSWLLGLCEALDVDPPVPPTADYRFELPVHAVDREGRESTNFIDCWKAGHFAMEAKAQADGKNTDALLRKAYGQLRNYIAHVSGDAPPYLMVVDVPRTLIVWDRWSGAYGDFAAGRRIPLATLHERPNDIALLRDIFEQPQVRDPRGRAQAVTKEIATGLAQLAARMETRGLKTEGVARFLMRCVFCCFAEDIGLLPSMLFRRALETARASGDADHLARALTSLWETMDRGGMYGAELLHRFNGHFFKVVESLPLQPDELVLLIEAAKHDWSRVEPSIFGTLLVRALDPEERHRLGAEYTPREFIERLVEPTVVEPIRERWTAVQAAVLQLEDEWTKEQERKAAEPKEFRKRKAKAKQFALPQPIAEAVKQLMAFHTWLRGLQFLDPACGSGNFLYVTMAAVKRIELEVLNEIHRLSHGQGELVLDEVHPRQFHGIEVKRWAREIAELTLWIGYHQFWRETHGGRTPPDPILEDTGTIEHRDAVLLWEEKVRRPERDRPDPTPRVVHPVTAELVPDPEAKHPYWEYVNARPAEWPRADFIIGNPPYIGNKRMRDALGDGYVDALRGSYPDLPESIDFVMYWWHRAAVEVAEGRTVRAGLITTNSITQLFHQPIISAAASRGAHVVWAAPDHPWEDGSDAAAVRVAMTVLAGESGRAVRIAVDAAGAVTRTVRAARFNPDLSVGADVATSSAIPLQANTGLSSRGFTLVGRGFVIGPDEAARLLAADARNAQLVRPYVNGQDLASRTRGVHVIDAGLMSEQELRSFPMLYDRLRDRVYAERQGNGRKSYRDCWWRFGEPRRELRSATAGLATYIVTGYVARHRWFTRLDGRVAPDETLVAIASDDAFALGVLSTSIHSSWAAAAGTRLGIGNDPRYNNTRCFDAFPFPDPGPALRTQIAALAERLDTHRAAAIARDERVTMTGMYNVAEKLRSGEPLTSREGAIHEIAACGVLRDLHDELDTKVAEAYGWPWPMARDEILERVVALHDARVLEEQRGIVRWLRPDYQVPRFGTATVSPTAASLPLPASPEAAAAATGSATPPPPWPRTAIEQLSAIAALLSTRALTVDEVTASFSSAPRSLVERHLETLALMGELSRGPDGRYRVAERAA